MNIFIFKNNWNYYFIYLIIVFYVYSKQRSLLYVPNIDNYDDETLSLMQMKFSLKIVMEINSVQFL